MSQRYILIETVVDGSEYHYSQKTELDGITYTLRFIWNSRGEWWTFFLETLDGEPIYGGRPVVPFVDLLRKCVHSKRPPGKLVCIPIRGPLTTPGLEDLGTRFQLNYLPLE